MDNAEILALYLDAPLQSWGHQSRFDRRTTLSWPTRSGVIGMVAAAMGIPREDREGLARLAPLRMTALLLAPADPARTAGTRLMDFHTVGGGYDPKTERRHMPRKAGGSSPGTVVSHREYLQDTRFGILMAGDLPLLEAVKAALENPRWGLFLGRKSCIPASPVCQGLFNAETEAVRHLEAISGWRVERAVHECSSIAEGNDTLMDIPLDFAGRTFAPRRIRTDALAP